MGIWSSIKNFFLGRPEKVEIEIEPVVEEEEPPVAEWWERVEPPIEEEEIIEEVPPVREELEEIPEDEEIEEVPEFIGIYRYTYAIMFVEHWQYYSIVVQGWSEEENDTHIEDMCKDEASRLLRQVVNYDLEEWFDSGLAVTEADTWEELPYDRSLEKLIGTVEGRVEFKHSGSRWQRWGVWKEKGQNLLSDLL